MKNLALLKEKALANILLLFEFWGLEYKKINDIEYDFINPTRIDNNFGACRFNTQKGLGADFTGNNISKKDYESFGPGFSREDFASMHQGKAVNYGFDVIGLCQRLHKLSSYGEAIKKLEQDLKDISKDTKLESVTLESIARRQRDIDDLNAKKKNTASKTWQYCVPINGTLGEIYLHTRGIILSEEEPNIKFHSKILNMEQKKYLPALLFRVQKDPSGPLLAIHRIYTKEDGKGKAELNNPKVALGNIKGLGIWFGKPNETLCIVEGPENALSIRSLGYDFVVSTISAANYSNLTIPDYVKNIILMPDGDEAGVSSARKAVEAYSKVGSKIKLVFPPSHKDKPKWDWNDELMKIRGKNG